jgi:hypothetical protein
MVSHDEAHPMTTRKSPSPESTTSTATKAIRSASWMSLLALTLGAASARTTTTTEIRGEAPSGRGPMRLVVQEYEADADGHLSRRARARSFAQRKVTPAELRKGVQVDLVDLSEEAAPGRRVVVAWVERGEVSTDFDGRTAKPAPGSPKAKSKMSAGHAKLTLALPPPAHTSTLASASPPVAPRFTAPFRFAGARVA